MNLIMGGCPLVAGARSAGADVVILTPKNLCKYLHLFIRTSSVPDVFMKHTSCHFNTNLPFINIHKYFIYIHIN